MIGVATGTLHRLFEMKQFICLLILVIGVLNTHGSPLSVQIGAGTGLPSVEGIVNGIVGSGSSNTSEASSPAASSNATTPSVPSGSSNSSVTSSPAGSSNVTTPSVPAGSSNATTPSVPVGSSNSSEGSSPAGSSNATTPSVPVESSNATESSVPTPEAESSTESPSEDPLPPVPSESPSSSPPSTNSTGSTNSTPSESTEPTEVTTPSSTTPEWENPKNCLGSCPAVDSYDSVYLVHESCENFCQCSNGVAIVLSCPEGLHFNRKLNVCDWPLNAKCARLGILN